MKIKILVLASLLFSLSAVAQQQGRVAPARKMVAPSYQQPAASGWGSGFTHELDVNFSEGSFKSYKAGTKSISDFNVFATYSHDLMSQFQVGGDIGFQSVDSVSAFTIAGTGTYNFDADYSNSFFVKAGLGLYPVVKATLTGVETKSEFGFYAGAGKRFKIWDHVNYKPSIAVRKVSDADPEFIIQFFNISLNSSTLF